MNQQQQTILDAIRQRDQARNELAQLKYGSQQAARDAFMAERLASAQRDLDRARMQILSHIESTSGSEAMRAEAQSRGWQYLLDGGGQ